MKQSSNSHYRDGANSGSKHDTKALEEQNRDFLLRRHQVSAVQFVGLLLCGFFLLGFGTSVWILYVSRSLGSSDPLDITILVLGSVVCAFFIYLAWLNFRRAFIKTSRH
jgi:hypothetical protein